MTVFRLITATLFVGVASVGMALADDDKAEDAQEKAALAQAKLSLGEAITAAQALVAGGMVVKAEVDTENGVPTYVVDLEKDGMQRVLVDIRSGEAKMAPAEADKSENGDNGDNGDDGDEDEDED